MIKALLTHIKEGVKESNSMGSKQFIIEGNIGCGKSTLLEKLSYEDNIEVFMEPLNAWQDIKDANGDSILDVFYKDPKRYAYLFQSIVFKTRLRSLDVPQKKPIRLMERSILTDNHVFMQSMIDMDMVSSMERECYNQWYDWLKDKCFVNPTAIIYIRSSPEVCYHRIAGRGRTAEATISTEYLEKLHDKHDEWLYAWTGCPVHIVDNPMHKDIDELVDEVKKLINSFTCSDNE